MNGALIYRDIRLSLRDGGHWLLGVLFFILFLSLCAIGLGGQITVINPLAPALFWLALILSTLLAVSVIFTKDAEDGSLEQLRLSGLSPLVICVSKAVSFITVSVLPIFLVIPVAGQAFAMSGPHIAGLWISIIAAAPAIAAYSVFAGALTLTRGLSGYLIILVTLPFLIPVLIFAVAGVDSFTREGLWAVEFRALFGLSLIACAVGLPAASAALNAQFDE